jgi:hypothetical protein
MSGPEVIVGGRYRLGSLVGVGGMGRVWLARDEVLHRPVAVKEVLLPPTLTTVERTELCQRMLREGRAAGRLSHPNVVAIFDVVQEGDRPWIVMEYVQSRSLYQVIREDGPVTPRRAAEVGLAVLSALRAAHQAKVLHRDVKPGNVLLAEDGRIVLTDFGLATFDGDGDITEAGLIMGSAQYIAPERARDGVSTPEADLWSLGATLYAAVEGRSPYARESSMATLTALATEPPAPARRAGPLTPVLNGLLRKDPRQRMRAPEVERLLRQVAQGRNPALGGRGARFPRPRVASDVAVEAGVSGGADHDTAAAAGAPAPVRMRTATEETLHYSPPHRKWPWAAAAGAVAAVGLVAVITLLPRGTAEPTGTGPDTSAGAASEVLTAAMGVDACIRQSPAEEVLVTPGPTTVPGGYGLINPNFTYHLDPTGFHLQVPIGWRLSRIGSLVCFRDPTARKAVSVDVGGRREGDPVVLLDEAEAQWRSAAGLTGYERLGLEPTFAAEGSADLEYTYVSDGTVMHGENRMVRMDGALFTISGLTTDLFWPTDRDVLNLIQVSLGLFD